MGKRSLCIILISFSLISCNFTIISASTDADTESERNAIFGGIIIDIDIINDCVQIRVKNNRNQVFQIKLDECCIFKKLSQQEKVILGVLDYLEK